MDTMSTPVASAVTDTRHIPLHVLAANRSAAETAGRVLPKAAPGGWRPLAQFNASI